MVLESILSPEAAERHPWEIIFLSLVFVSIGVWSTLYLGYPSGFLTVAFVAVPSVPLILNLFKYDEEEVVKEKVWGSALIARHLPVILVLLFYFIGLIAGFVFWYLALPPEASAQVFSSQIQELKSLSGLVSLSGFAIKTNLAQAFEVIFLHNLGVLALILLFSILYSAGVVLILIWNASVISVFLANIAKGFVFHEMPSLSLISGLSFGVLGILPHGTFELLAYWTAALAGGIMSSALVRKAYLKGGFAHVVNDSAKLVAWSIIFLAVGALIEGHALSGGV
jgi:uncharacterized membrane protein SpoIIM required for sporulation